MPHCYGDSSSAYLSGSIFENLKKVWGERKDFPLLCLLKVEPGYNSKSKRTSRLPSLKAGACLRPKLRPGGSRFTPSRTLHLTLKGGASPGRTGEYDLTRADLRDRGDFLPCLSPVTSYFPDSLKSKCLSVISVLPFSYGAWVSYRFYDGYCYLLV
jgi:hypothetical protein